MRSSILQQFGNRAAIGAARVILQGVLPGGHDLAATHVDILDGLAIMLAKHQCREQLPGAAIGQVDVVPVEDYEIRLLPHSQPGDRPAAGSRTACHGLAGDASEASTLRRR